MSAGLVSVIVVNWNGAPDLQRELASLSDQDYPTLEVIVVDNGSTDESETVVRGFPSAIWHGLGANRGLAYGLAYGAKRSTGEYILFLNNDMYFDRPFISRLVASYRECPVNTFAIDVLQRESTSTPVDHAAVRLVKQRWPRGTVPGWTFAQTTPETKTDTLFVSASSLFTSREAYFTIGGWDPAYPISWEDVDLSLRAWRRGYSMFIDPSICCYHDVGSSARTDAGRIARYRGEAYGKLRFAVKHLPCTSVAYVFVEALASLGWHALHRDKQLVLARAFTLGQILSEFPELIRLRYSEWRLPGRMWHFQRHPTRG